jgi:DNA-binding transcriptional MocR family regulator
MDDLLPGMLHLSRDGGDTLTRQLTDQLRELITNGHLAPGQRLPSSRQLAQSLACRATPSRLRSSNWPRKATSRFPPDAGRRWPKAFRSTAAGFIAKQPRRKRADKPVGLGTRPAPGELAARS